MDKYLNIRAQYISQALDLVRNSKRVISINEIQELMKLSHNQKTVIRSTFRQLSEQGVMINIGASHDGSYIYIVNEGLVENDSKLEIDSIIRAIYESSKEMLLRNRIDYNIDGKIKESLSNHLISKQG
jgi:predicted transcriptional regulator of viral defense system